MHQNLLLFSARDTISQKLLAKKNIVSYKSIYLFKVCTNLCQKKAIMLWFASDIDILSKVCTNVLLSAVVNQINYFIKNFNALFIVSMTICMNKVIISLILLKHPEHSARGRRIRGGKVSRAPQDFGSNMS